MWLRGWMKLLRSNASPVVVAVNHLKGRSPSSSDSSMSSDMSLSDRAATSARGVPMPLASSESLTSSMLSGGAVYGRAWRNSVSALRRRSRHMLMWNCLLYTSDAADDLLCVDLGGRRI